MYILFFYTKSLTVDIYLSLIYDLELIIREKNVAHSEHVTCIYNLHNLHRSQVQDGNVTLVGLEFIFNSCYISSAFAHLISMAFLVMWLFSFPTLINGNYNPLK